MNSALPVQQDFLGTIVRRRSLTGLRLTQTVLPEHSRTPKHFHDRGLLGWSLKGSYTNAYTRGAQDIHSSRMMFCPAGELHTTFSEAGAVSFALEMEPGWIERLEEASLPHAPAMFELGSMDSLMARLYGEFNETDKPSSIAIEGMALEMVAVGMRFPPKTGAGAPRWLTHVREILHERFREQITISSIAEQVDIHPVHLASTFRHKYGHSIAAYVHELRVHYASSQLSDSQDSLAAIAHAAGFCDQSHLCRIFKRLTGMTPARYRSLSRKS
jgi:AraC family transcriptional regulator